VQPHHDRLARDKRERAVSNLEMKVPCSRRGLVDTTNRDGGEWHSRDYVPESRIPDYIPIM